MATQHATALVMGDRGVLLRGHSGAGKSLLALLLVDRCKAAGRFACLVADDRVHLEAVAGRLVCSVPPAIAGLVEIRGSGPQPVDFERSAVLDLVVDLAEGAPRYPEQESVVLEGVAVGYLALVAGDLLGALAAVLHRIDALAAAPGPGAAG
jgi:hypothetical protein